MDEKTVTADTRARQAPDSWVDAWKASPGPESIRDAFPIAAKGFCMGTADIIPGVSGGTIAFITGIYERLLSAITSFDAAFIRHIARGNLKGAVAHAHLRFLLPLLCGIGLALVSLAHLMHWLLEHHKEPTWSLFFGLIAASTLVVSKEVKDWKRGAAPLVLGTAAAWFIVGMIPVETPERWWFIFLCGMIAICAMILPGISGSFLLLMLGKYEYVTGAIKDPFIAESIIILAVFGCGAVVGLAGFSRILKECLVRGHNATMSALMGFMIGGMRKIWPWKTVTFETVAGKERMIRSENILPDTYDWSFLLCVALALVGLAAIMMLEGASERKAGSRAEDSENG